MAKSGAVHQAKTQKELKEFVRKHGDVKYDEKREVLVTRGSKGRYGGAGSVKLGFSKVLDQMARRQERKLRKK